MAASALHQEEKRITMNALPLILLAIALILFTIAWLVHPATSGGVCDFQPNVDRITCPEEACENDVPGCTQSNFLLLANECIGTGAGCDVYSDKGSCNEQYGCEWENEASITIAILTTLSAMVVILILGIAGYATYRWLAQRRQARAPKTSPTTTATKNEVDEKTDSTKMAPIAIPTGGDEDCDETLEVEVDVAGEPSVQQAEQNMEDNC